jgi:hypothetical protein
MAGILRFLDGKKVKLALRVLGALKTQKADLPIAVPAKALLHNCNERTQMRPRMKLRPSDQTWMTLVFMT